jgi:hypothetical protein
MSISIATRGYFTPSVGTGVIQATGGGTGFVAELPPLPIVYILDIDDKELGYPLIQVTNIENGVNNNENN